MSRPVLLLQLGADPLPEVVPVPLMRGSWAPAVYTPPVLPGPELAIVGGIITVNCAYSDFHLLLDADVDGIEWINVGDAASDADVVTIDVEIAGAFTFNPGPSCTPISGVSYVPSTTVGAVDVLGFKTFNRAETWRYTVQQPAAGALAVTLSPSPASATVDYAGSAVAPSVQVTAATAGGTAPVTHKWTRADSGGTNFLIDDDTLAAPTFSVPAGSSVFSTTQQWRDTVTDAAAVSAQATVGITLARTASVGSGAAVNVTNHTVSAEAWKNPEYETASARITVQPSGALQWDVNELTSGQPHYPESGTYAGEWLASGPASGARVRATQTGGGTAPSGSATGVWYAGDAGASWYIDRFGIGPANTCVLLLEFQDAVTFAPLDSCTITLSADVN